MSHARGGRQPKGIGVDGSDLRRAGLVRPLSTGVALDIHRTAPHPPTDPAVLGRIADGIRLRAVRMVARHGFGYLGQALSSAELFATLYGSAARYGTDRIVVSPGHYVIAAFAAAAEMGFADDALLDKYGQDGSSVEAIGTERTPMLDYTCGSLGQGLSAAVGFAVADRILGHGDTRTYAVISDGEVQEGQVWEAAMFAGHHHLDRITVLLDANNSQVDGPVDEITTIEPLADKWTAFGWDAVRRRWARRGCHPIRGEPVDRGGPATGRDLPHVDASWLGMPAGGRRRALHQARLGSGSGRRR